MAIQSFYEWKISTMTETIFEKSIVIIGFFLASALILAGVVGIFRQKKWFTGLNIRKLKGLLAKTLDFKRVILLLIFLWFVFYQFYPFLVRVGCASSNKKYGVSTVYRNYYDRCIHMWGLK